MLSTKVVKAKSLAFRASYKKKFESKKFNLLNKLSNKIKLLIIFILIFFEYSNKYTFLLSNSFLFNDKFLHRDDNNISDKWIVMTAFNPPTKSIINFTKSLKHWKIVVIGNIKTIDSYWNIFNNYNNLIYLSIKAQNNLGYNILKFLPDDSYCRKNIGYLFAIQNGAKEIYEIEEDLTISTDYLNNLDYNINNSYVCYGIQNEEKMINPYAYFGETNIWPRGFFIGDVNKNKNTTFNIVYSNLVRLKPLIYQGLINRVPDVDSLFISTLGKNINNLDIKFQNNVPLIYTPGNFVPINSKNTKYLYEIFPFLMLPIFVNENIADILRGYLIQFFVYEYGGTIVFHNTYAYNNKYDLNNSKFLEEKELFFNLTSILKIIKSCKSYKGKNPIKFLFYILNKLIKNKLLQKQEIKIYKAFLEDLSNLGYIYPSQFIINRRYNNSDFLDINTEYKFYLPSNYNILKRNNMNYRIMSHFSPTKSYNDILLIITYLIYIILIYVLFNKCYYY